MTGIREATSVGERVWRRFVAVVGDSNVDRNLVVVHGFFSLEQTVDV